MRCITRIFSARASRGSSSVRALKRSCSISTAQTPSQRTTASQSSVRAASSIWRLTSSMAW
jgi:hypothetical protein